FIADLQAGQINRITGPSRPPRHRTWRGKRSVEPGTLTDPRQGAQERHPADAPLRGRGPSTASCADTRAARAQVGGFREADLDARASVRLSCGRFGPRAIRSP